MICPYTYRAGDDLVKSGKKNIGDICGVTFGSAEYGGYCAPHARAMGTISPEALQKEKDRRAQTKEEQRKRKENATKIVADKMGQANDPGNPILNQTVLEAMGLKDPCDLADEYAVLKSLNQKPTYESYDEKMAFARWLESPMHLRNPKTMEDAAVILGVSTNTLFVWKGLPEVIDFINMDTEKRALGMFPLAIYKLGVNIDRGDVKSIETLIKYCKEKQDENNKKRKALNIPKNMLKEADDFAKATVDLQSRGVPLAAEKNMVVTDHFNESMIKDN